MSDLSIAAIPRKRGAPDVVCRLGDEVVHRDQMHPGKQADRKRFCDAVHKAVPAIELDEVDAKLIFLADDLDKQNGEQDEPQFDLCGAAEIDVSRIARLCGMRCPSEVLNLKWSDIIWDKDKIRIDSPKTGLRFCPLFPELRPILDRAHFEAPDGATFCVQRYRKGYNPATTMATIIQRAGHEAWPKLFTNCRSTRRTELERVFPNHVVNKWLGHSAKTAEKHYLQVQECDWSNGASKPTVELRGNAGGNTGGNTLGNMGAHAGIEAQKKLVKTGAMVFTGCGIAAETTPQGASGSSPVPSAHVS